MLSMAGGMRLWQMASDNDFGGLAGALAWREGERVAGRRVVMTNGCFDLLHAGHVRYLAEARSLGDALVVAVNSDQSVAALKGPGRPVNPAADWAEVLAALRAVDCTVIFDDVRATKVIEALKPDVYAKGGDYTVDSLNPEERAALEACGAEIRILGLVPGKSTSGTLARMSATSTSRGACGWGCSAAVRAAISSPSWTRFRTAGLTRRWRIVMSDNPEAYILERARAAGIPAVHVEPGPYKTRLGDAAQKEIRDRLVASGVDLVLLAGFMRLVKEPILSSFKGRILNIHPSLLPAFPGLAAWKQAVDAGVSESGCTVHEVDGGMDTGRISGPGKSARPAW